MSLYLLINILVIAVPLAFSFERKVQFYRKFPAVLGSILIVGTVYVIWDVIATRRGDWAFNPDYILGVSLFGLPLEEVMFFITIPFACLFIYENFRTFMPEFRLPVSRIVFVTLLVVLVINAILNLGQHYTATVLFAWAAFIAAALLVRESLLYSGVFWSFIVFTLVPFLAVNYVLTSTPVVTYNPEAFSGIRVTTIPLEDFAYSISMLSFHVLIYHLISEKWPGKTPLQS
ncbi:lycopene cyclase domain-containing protein [Balneolales bacterium ANBcel1]|nr:lycopene cyclase domain-containing protein [Balneolales bacterium ANBcel1]